MKIRFFSRSHGARERRWRSRPGFLLLEVLLGITVFSIFLGGISMVLLNGQEETVGSGNRLRAAFLTQRALEAMKSMRNAGFAGLSAGQHGVVVGPSGTWAFSGTAATETGFYTTNLFITSLASDWIRATADTRWKHGITRSGSVVLTTEVTDWRSVRSIGNWGSVSLQGSYSPSGTALFNQMDVAGNYAYVTGDASGGGNGLYIMDISDPASPQRVNATFSLGASGYGVAVRGKRLYMATSSSTQEISVYDISDPAAFSSAQLIASYNLPGSGRATDLAIHGNTLYVTAQQSGTVGQDELYSFDISNSGSIVFLASMNDTGNMNAIALTGTAAYIASAVDNAELRVLNITQSSSLILDGSYNLTDGSQDAVAIAVAGSAALLGRQKSTTAQEVILFEKKKGEGTPDPPPGPYYHEASGSVIGLAMDPAGCFGFIATDWAGKGLKIINIRSSLLPELSFYDSSPSPGRGVYYDIVRDRLYFLTSTGFFVFRPGVPTGTCL